MRENLITFMIFFNIVLIFISIGLWILTPKKKSLKRTLEYLSVILLQIYVVYTFI